MSLYQHGGSLSWPAVRRDGVRFAFVKATESDSYVNPYPLLRRGDALAEIAGSREVIESLAADDEAHYGVSTGFGALATRHIPVETRAAAAQLRPLPRRRVRCRGRARGRPCPDPLRLSTLATGRTGIRVGTAQAYAELLDAGITPTVHAFGSLGCSGDLAPLAHAALTLMGEGEVRDAAGRLRPAAEVLAQALVSLARRDARRRGTSTR